MTARAEAPLGPLDPRLRTSIGAISVCAAVLTFVALLVFGLKSAVSVALGGALAVGNLWALARIVAALLPHEEAGARAQSRGAWALLAMLKMLGLLGFAWLLMRHGIVTPIPLLVGFGSLPIGIAIGSLVSDRSAPPEDP
jgi:apolipoprotein N-acyltransferase